MKILQHKNPDGLDMFRPVLTAATNCFQQKSENILNSLRFEDKFIDRMNRSFDALFYTI